MVLERRALTREDLDLVARRYRTWGQWGPDDELGHANYVTPERVAALPSDDWRRSAPAFTTELQANLRVADALAHVAERHGVPTAAAAAAWTLGFPGVTGAIVGARTPAQIDGWLPAASVTLTAEDYAEVEAARG